MDKRIPIPEWLTPFNITGSVFVVLVVAALPRVFGKTHATAALIIAVSIALAPVAGIAFILGVVRWLNRRDDRRYDNRPPDAP
jgi:hypothetical protein